MRFPSLGKAGEPFIFVRRGDRTRHVIAEYGGSSIAVRKLRGQKCRSLAEFMTEIGAVLQFFDGFGENANALRECLSYLDEWLPADGYIIVITRTEEFLAEEPEHRGWMLDLLLEIGEWWSQPLEGQGRFDRPPMPFKVVLEFELDSGVSDWICLLQERNIGFETVG